MSSSTMATFVGFTPLESSIKLSNLYLGVAESAWNASFTMVNLTSEIEVMTERCMVNHQS